MKENTPPDTQTPPPEQTEPRYLPKRLFAGIYNSLLLIAVAGFLDAVYLAGVHLSADRTCGGGNGCTAALNSEWSVIWGVPVAALGAGLYLALIWLTVLAMRPRKEAAARQAWLSLISAAGTGVSLFFTFLQATVIGEWCPFCLLSAGLVTLFFLLSLANGLKTGALQAVFRKPGILKADVSRVLLAFAAPPLIVLAVSQATGQPVSARAAAQDRVVGMIGNETYTLKDVDQAIRGKLQQLDEERYNERKAFLDERLIALEASARKMTSPELLRQALQDKVRVSEDDIRHYIWENRAGLPSDITPDLVGQIKTLLGREKYVAARRDFLVRLRKKYGAVYHLPPPARLTITLRDRGEAEKGPADAPVTLIVYTDFQCPFCRRTHRALHDLMQRFPGKIHLVFRNFPLSRHKWAQTAAERAWCAGRQGRFWPYADLVFAHQGSLSEEALQDYARQAGIADMDAFNRCIASGAGKNAVAEDIASATDLGVDATPSLFINGRFFAGMPQDIDTIIQEEIDNHQAAKK